MTKRPDDHVIVAIHVTNRVKQASQVQALLTRYGANIKTRIGLHEANGRTVAPNGIILLEMVGQAKRSRDIVAALNRITGVESKSLLFQH